jgi:hypothetical protein
MKILSNLLKNSTAEHYKGNNTPSGFTKCGSNVDHIYIRQILEKYSKQEEDISLIFYNLERVYDSAQRELLWQALGKANVSQSVMQIIKIIYGNNKGKITMSCYFLNTKS